MKRIFVLLAILNFVFFANAQSTAMQLLDATAARMGQKGGISGSFTATSYSGKKVKNQTSGTLIMQGSKYALNTPDMHTWYNGEYQWSLINGSDEVNRTKPTAAELHHSSPSAFLGIYKSGYNLSMKNTKLRGQKVSEVTMKAIGTSKQPQQVILDIDPATNSPLCMRILYKGNWTRISISDIKAGSAKPSDFEFPSKDYPKVTVVNM